MSAPDDFWSAATQPRYPHARYLNAAYNRPQPAPADEPEPEQPSGDIAAIAALDTVAYAKNRDAIMAEYGGGPRSGEWLGGVEKPQPRPALTAEQMVELRLGFGAHAHPSPPTGRALDPDYQSAQQYAAGHSSLSGPHRDISSMTRESR